MQAIPFSRRFSAPELCQATLRKAPPQRREAERRQAHPLGSRIADQFARYAQTPSAVRRALIERARLSALHRGCSAPGRASWNHRVQTGGPSPAPVQRAPRSPITCRTGRCPEPPGAGLRHPLREPHSLRQSAVTGDVPSMSEIRLFVTETVTCVNGNVTSILGRHARACRGHPRLVVLCGGLKTWMAGTSPAMTRPAGSFAPTRSFATSRRSAVNTRCYANQRAWSSSEFRPSGHASLGSTSQA